MNNDNPLVSIIVRTKDRPKLLERALQSIAAQTYRPLEVVLVNDGGCDLDADELRSILGDVSLNYIRLERNTGRAHAGNVGVENSKGEYIGFLDDDDEHYPEHVETLVTFLEQSDYKVAYADTEMVSRDMSGEDQELNRTKVFSRDFSYDDLLFANYIPFNSIMFSRTALDSGERLDESFELYEDWDLLIRIGRRYPFSHIRKITAKYNQWNRSLQINQADEGHVEAVHRSVISKHRERIFPEVSLNIYREKEGLRAEKEGLRAEKEALKRRLEALKQRYKIVSTNMAKSLRERDERIVQMENRIKENNSRIVDLESVIHAMRGSLGWQMLEGFRRAREKTLPPDTRRRKAYDMAIKSIKVLKDQGARAFAKKARNKLRGISYEKKSASALNVLPQSIDKSDLQHFPTRRKLRVLFLKGEWAGLTNHYRVYNMVEYLKLNDIYADVLDICDLPSKSLHAFTFDLVIIHRIPLDPLLDHFIKTCKELNIIVVFDLDDYLFDPSVIHLIEWVKHVPSSERDQLVGHIERCRQTFDACDYFICPTDFLHKKAAENGKEAYVIRNGFNKELLDIFLKEAEKSAHTTGDDVIRIGYFSGTKTHQRDFHSIAQAVLRILNGYDNVRLYVCGLLDLDQRFDGLLHKIEKASFVPLEQLAHHIAKIDVNIAPLEGDNIFCEGKSELKYFYAGILKIPTVATPTDAFRFAVEHGENGFLASTEEQWYTCLKTLVEDAGLRKNMGEKAFSHVMKTYTPAVLADKTKDVYERIIDNARKIRDIDQRSISASFLVSDVSDNLHRYPYVLQIAEILVKNGHFVRIYFFRPDVVAPRPSGNSKIHIVEGMDGILSSDVLISTDPYNSSSIAYQNRNRAAQLIYLRMNENCGEIPYQWSALFDEIPFSSNLEKIGQEIENIVWRIASPGKP